MSYDNDGNVLSDGSHTYTWDAYGHALTADGIGLTYDALGSMAEQNHSGAYTQIVYSPTGGKMAIMNGQSLSFGYFPLPSGLAEYHPNGVLYYRHADWLGTTRLVSSTTRTMYSDTAYAPFGETYAQGGSLDWSFTGMNQDTASGLFDFPAREYSIQGRWPSPDPAGIAAVNPANPQSWNRYAYVLNNPLALIDPLGLICNGATSTSVGGDPLANGTGIFTQQDCQASGGTWGDSWLGGGGNGGSGGGIPGPHMLCGPTLDDNGVMYGWVCDDDSFGVSGSGGKGLTASKGSRGSGKTSTAQIKETCLNQFYSTAPGKTVEFVSPLQMIPGFGQNPKVSVLETATSVATKGTAVTAAANAAQPVVHTLAADSWNLAGPLENFLSWAGTKTLSFARAGGLTIWGYAAGLDTLAHAGCGTIARQANGQMAPTPISGGAIP